MGAVRWAHVSRPAHTHPSKLATPLAFLAISLGAAGVASAEPPVISEKSCWGRISAVGCCIGDRLLYCEAAPGEASKLRQLDCRGKPRCGWRATGRYDCNTAGAADPAGRHARFCSLPDAGLPFDLGAAKGDGGCGKVTEEGCCFAEELRFCHEGKLRRISCKPNRFCGWRGVAQAYNCGTEGKADPRGKYPRNCAGAPDAGPQRFPDRGLASASAQGKAAPGGCAGCSCELGGSAGGSAQQLLGLLLLAALVTRRRG
jgi:MYXO-CTERM domain-containing protein